MNTPTELPALLGGPKAVVLDQTEANRWPVITEEDEEAVIEVLRSGQISVNPVTRLLENDYREKIGSAHALSHCNGTAALMASFFAFNIESGDEIIVPSATFWASVLPMLWFGAVPVFCESENERLGLDPEDVERKITSKTKAIVVVHLWGMPSKMTELFELALKYDLRILEDASHAHGAVWRDQPCGSLGDISVFSMQGDKLVPAGEGGMLLTDNDEYLEKATLFGDMMRVMEIPSPARRFAATTFGVKTRMAPLSAALGRVQLKHLNERNAARNQNIVRLSKRLETLNIDTFLGPAHVERVYFEFLVRNEPSRTGIETDLLIKALQAEGCLASCPRYPLLHQQPFFTEGHFASISRVDHDGQGVPIAYDPDDLPRTIAENEKMVKLPSFPSADDELLDSYAAAFEKVLSNADEIKQFGLESTALVD